MQWKPPAFKIMHGQGGVSSLLVPIRFYHSTYTTTMTVRIFVS